MMIPNMEISAIAVHVLDKWVKHFGFLRSICSEMGAGFEMALWFALCRMARVWRSFEHYPSLLLPEKFH